MNVPAISDHELVSLIRSHRRNYATELTHVELKLKLSEEIYHVPNAKSRITGVLSKLLERQFICTGL